MKKKILGLLVSVILVASISGCGLFGGSDDSNPTALTSPININVTCNQTTGKDVYAEWDAVPNAQYYDVTVKEGTRIVDVKNVTESRIKLDESKLVKDTEYTVTIVARAEGYKSSAPAVHPFTYTYTPILDQLTMSDLFFDKETQILSWAPVAGVRATDSYEIIIKNPNGQVVQTYNTPANGLPLTGLNLPKFANAGTATVIAKGDGVTTSDSSPKTIVLVNGNGPLDEKTVRMQAYAAWETDLKDIISEMFRPQTGPGPVVTDIHAVDMKDDGTVVIYHSRTAGDNVYALTFNVGTLEGETYQDKLNDMNTKISNDNRIYTLGIGINKSISVLNNLVEYSKTPDNKMPNDNLKTAASSGIEVESIVGGVGSISNSGGIRTFVSTELAKINGNLYFMTYGISHPSDGSSNAQIYNALRDNPNKITEIVEGDFVKLDASAILFRELKDEYEKWIALQG